MESSFRTQKKEIFNCKICNFKNESERGLKVHINRKHDTVSDDKFPKTCEFFDEKMYSQDYLETHLKEHTYKSSNVNIVIFFSMIY